MATQPEIVTKNEPTSQNVNQNYDLGRFSVENLTYTEKLLRDAKLENIQLHDKLKELLTDNALLDKQNTDLRMRMGDLSTIKLSIRRVHTFLMLCQPGELQDDSLYFYVKMEDGQMARIFREHA